MDSEIIDEMADFAYWPSLFSAAECRQIIEYSNSYGYRKSETYNLSGDDFRKSFELEITSSMIELSWAIKRIYWAIKILNDKHFNLSVTGFQGFPRILKYEAPDCHFVWHTDRSLGVPVRKLSFSVLLTEGSTFDGGDLQINDGTIISAERNLGGLFVFPSFTLHRVTPVIAGTRHAIVGWITGPRFS